MAKHGKKYLAAAAKVDREHLYTPKEAIELAKETTTTNFDATVEMHIRLGVDPRHAEQQVRNVVVLPHGLGKSVSVLVFAQGEGASLAREAGADFVADDDALSFSPNPLSQQIQSSFSYPSFPLWNSRRAFATLGSSQK